MSHTVFVSSTCYDLIDLRAELATDLSANGITPIMSDRPASEFAVVPDQSSIETCLANVRKSDTFVVILSQRYGPRLGKVGFEDISATHLEYREARKHDKPVYMYVRDRLEADYNVWRRNQEADVVLPWVKIGDEGIFALMEEHRTLVNQNGTSNWFWVFRDSVELKQQIRNDLGAVIGQAVLQRLVEEQKVAFLLPTLQSWEINDSGTEIAIHAIVHNAGTAIAIDPSFECTIGAHQCGRDIDTVTPGGNDLATLRLPLGEEERSAGRAFAGIELQYTTPEGYRIADDLTCFFGWTNTGKQPSYNAVVGYLGKTFHRPSAFHLRTREGRPSPTAGHESDVETSAH